MSAEVDGKPLAQWTEEELRDALDRYVMRVPSVDREKAILAESVSRCLTGLIHLVKEQKRCDYGA
jgi:hypothetical protein